MEPEVQGRGSQDWEEVGTSEPMELIETGSVETGSTETKLGSGRGIEVEWGMEEEQGTRTDSIESMVVWGKTKSSK